MPSSPTISGSAREAQDGRDAARRTSILDAARACFFQFGFDKTSLDDIAQGARISRPLIYRKYKNKEQLFGAVFESFFEPRYALLQQTSEGRASRREKLLRVFELLLVEPWQEMSQSPLAHDFHEVCARLHPALEEKHQRLLLKHAQAQLGSKELAELFLLAADGLTQGRPAAKVLRRRLELLAEQFIRG